LEASCSVEATWRLHILWRLLWGFLFCDVGCNPDIASLEQCVYFELVEYRFDLFYFGLIMVIKVIGLLEVAPLPPTLKCVYFTFDCCILLRLSVLILYGAVSRNCFLFVY
jgi:hypothetical protein